MSLAPSVEDLAYMSEDLRNRLRTGLKERRSALGTLEPKWALLETRLNQHDELVQRNIERGRELTAHIPDDEAQELLNFYDPGHDDYPHKIQACLNLRDAQQA